MKISIEILEDKKEELKLKLKPLDQGFMALVKDELWNTSGTEMAGFDIEHPDVNEAVFILKTKGREAKKVWNSAIESLMEKTDKFEKELKKLK